MITNITIQQKLTEGFKNKRLAIVLVGLFLIFYSFKTQAQSKVSQTVIKTAVDSVPVLTNSSAIQVDSLKANKYAS